MDDKQYNKLSRESKLAEMDIDNDMLKHLTILAKCKTAAARKAEMARWGEHTFRLRMSDGPGPMVIEDQIALAQATKLSDNIV